MELWIDDREHAVHSHAKYIKRILQQYKVGFQVDIKVCRLEIGDYCILENSHILFCIERKTLADLAASLKDGRKDNINKLLELRRQSPQCKLLYLIEGPSSPSLAGSHGRLPYTSLLAHLDHLMMRDGIHFLYSKNPEYTLERLVLMMKHYFTLPTEQRWGGAAESKLEDPSQLKELCPVRSEDDIRRRIWMSLKYVSTKTADVLAQSIELGDLVAGRIAERELAAIEYEPGRAIGYKRARKIIQSIEPETFLCSLPGISKLTASRILSSVDLPTLVNQGVPVDLQIGGKTINKNVVSSIQRFLQKPTSIAPE